MFIATKTTSGETPSSPGKEPIFSRKIIGLYEMLGARDMTAANRARVLTRWGAVGLMATAVLTATAGGFAQSYAGLYNWAKEHGLAGWKADSFPLLVDLFIIVGELGLFLLALDAFV